MFVLLKNYISPERESNEHFNKLNSNNLQYKQEQSYGWFSKNM